MKLSKKRNYKSHINKIQRNDFLLISAVLSFLWLIFSYHLPLGELNKESVPLLIMMVPYFFSTFSGVVFNWAGWLLNRKDFIISAIILFIVALLLAFPKSLGLIPIIIFNILVINRKD